MNYSIDEICEYIKCPLFYKFKRLNNLIEIKTIDQYYKEHIKTSIFYFYFSQIEKRPKAYESLLKKWETLWFSDDMIDMFGEDDLKHKSNKAVTVLTDFYSQVLENPETPIAAGFPYEIILNENDLRHICITGDIDLICIANDKTRNKETKLVSFSSSKNKPDDFLLRSDLKLTMASLAFRDSFKEQEDSIVINNIGGWSVPTSRSGGDFNRARKIVRSVCKGIEHKVFYPTSNKINCHSCPYKMYCLNERAI